MHCGMMMDTKNIKAYLDTGEIDVFIMICCSIEFMETGGQSDEAIWNFTDYALDKNPDTRIGLALPWKDYLQIMMMQLSIEMAQMMHISHGKAWHLI